MQLREALSPRINACPPFPSAWKGQVGYKASWSREPWASAEELTVVIKFNPWARPPGGDVAAVQASCSVGLLQRKGHCPWGPHEQPVDKTENMQIWVEYAFNVSVRTRRYRSYSLSRSPLILCQFRWWGRTKAEPCDTHTHKTMQVKHKKKGCWNKVKDTRVSHSISSSLRSTILVF